MTTKKTSEIKNKGTMSMRLITGLVLVISIVCMLLFSVSIVCLTVSLNPDVKWNEYKSDELYPSSGLYAFYYNTLWESWDASEYEGKPNSGHYMKIFNRLSDDGWKVDTRVGVMKALGLTSGSLFLLIVALSIHAVTEQKLFVVISNILSAIMGLTGGGICMQTISDYKDNLIKGIIPLATKDPSMGGFYKSEIEAMKLGYMLVYYGGIIIIVVCSLMIVQCMLYIKFGEGKWIWKKKTEVIPNGNDP